jgi:transcriptional regulator with XRE-family HTH domain
MSDYLITHIITIAKDHGISQKVLAQRAGVSEETLSRAKKRGSTRLDIVEALARAAGAHLEVLPQGFQRSLSAHSTLGATFQQKHRTLAWSNPNASPKLLLRRALVMPEFQTLLDAAIEFGVNTLTSEWEMLKASGEPDVSRAQPITERLLRNISDGYRQATA